MKSREYIENKIKQLEDLRSELLKEYQEKLDAGNNDEVLWQYISNKNIEIWTLKDILIKEMINQEMIDENKKEVADQLLAAREYEIRQICENIADQYAFIKKPL